jgi:hypothetical protein
MRFVWQEIRYSLYAQIFEQLLLQRNFCYHASHKTIWLQERLLSGFKLRMRGSQNRFLIAVAKAAA